MSGKIKLMITLLAAALTVVFVCGCGMLTPAKKPEVGPAGKPEETVLNPPLTQRFGSAPPELYDLEAAAGIAFECINKENWSGAQQGLSNIQRLWEQTKPLVGQKKGVKDADEALQKLTDSITQHKVTGSYENLNKFMGSIGDIAKSYKLSPLPAIIAVGNAVRNVSFYVEDKNWSKSASKVKELEDTWKQLKPGLEQIGILGETTKTHSYVTQLKDAVNAENKGAADEHIAKINATLGTIREFYRGK